MAYRNPLYNNVAKPVRDTISARAGVYGQKYRDDKGLDWAYAKTAYAKVKTFEVGTDGKNIGNELCLLSSNRKVPLNLPADASGQNALYSLDKGHRNAPNMFILESISITNKGRLGSVQDLNVKFTVFNENELAEAEQQILRTGLNIQVEYGWSAKLSSETDAASFDGIIHNFGWSLNEDGSFSCTVDATGRGFFGLGVPINAPMNTEQTLTEDLAGIKIEAFNLSTAIDEEIARLDKQNTVNTAGSSAVFQSPIFTVNGIGMCVMALDSKGTFKDIQSNQNQGTQTITTVPEDKPVYYLTLNELVEFINNSIIKQEPRLAKSMQYAIYKGNEGSPGGYRPDFVSCIPNEVLFSDQNTPTGMSTYGTVHYTIGTYDIRKDAIKEVDAMNLAYIWVSTDTIKQAFDEVVEKEGATDPSAKRISQFFEKLFQKIAYASGDLYQLAIRMDEISPTFTQLFIYDKNWNRPVGTIEPLEFGKGIKNAVLRDLQISAQLPDKMATQAYVGGRSRVSDDPSPTLDIGNSNEKDSSEQSKQRQRAIEVTTTLGDSKFYMGLLGWSETLSDQLYGAMKEYKTAIANDPKNKASWLENQFYPLNVELTLDGVFGFDFGNVLKVGYLPPRYRENMVFIVTNITHNIGGGDWTTTLTTQARIKQES